MVKITTFQDRPVRHVQFMPDGTVILKLYERRSDGRSRHLHVSLGNWLAAVSISWKATRHAVPRLGSSTVAAVHSEKHVLLGALPPGAGVFPERVTHLFPSSRATAFPGLSAGKSCPDRLVIHGVDGHDLRGRAVAAHHGDARRVDPEVFGQQGDDGLVGPALLGRSLHLHFQRLTEPADDFFASRPRHDLEAQASHELVRPVTRTGPAPPPRPGPTGRPSAWRASIPCRRRS